MNKKQLAIYLSKLKSFDSPLAKLEQYSTDSEIAADVLWRAFLSDDIKDKIIADFGCGNGLLGIGALKLGAKKVYFVDKDKKVLEVTKENCRFKNVNFVLSDISEFNENIDVVIENPPFGVQKRKADEVFLRKAMGLSKKIYSFHKIESNKFIGALCKKFGFVVEDVVEYNFRLKRTMKFHKRGKYYVKIGCWILKKV